MASRPDDVSRALPPLPPAPAMDLSQFAAGERAVSIRACENYARLYAQAALHAAGVPVDARTCTCHPDDNPPKPCPRKFALNECRAAAGVRVDGGLSREHAELMLLAAADLESWMKSYHRDGATEDTVKRLRDTALGVNASAGANNKPVTGA